MPRSRSKFGVHPTLEDALTAVSESDLPDDLDAILPAPRRMSSHELVAIGLLCAVHVRSKVGAKNRGEFDRLSALVERFLADPAQRASDPARPRSRDLGQAAQRDAEFARGALKVVALTAWSASQSGVDAARIIGDAARRALKLLAGDRPAQHALVRELCARFR